MNAQLLTDLQAKQQKYSKRKAKRGKRHKRKNRQSKPQSKGCGDYHHAHGLPSLHTLNAYPINSLMAGGLDELY